MKDNFNKEWWTEKHKEDNDVFLTGSTLKYIQDYIKDELKGDILICGVGKCVDSRELIDKGNNVDGMDVCKEALSKVKFNRTFIYPESKPPKGQYDYIVMFLVAQHINDEVLIPELEVLISALKPTGKLLFQHYENNINNRGTLAEEHGGYDRTKEHMESIVSSCGGKIIEYKYIEDFKWGVLHIGRS